MEINLLYFSMNVWNRPCVYLIILHYVKLCITCIWTFHSFGMHKLRAARHAMDDTFILGKLIGALLKDRLVYHIIL